MKLNFENLVNLSVFNLEIFTTKLTKHFLPKKSINLDFEKNENFLSLIKNGFIRKYFPTESVDNPIELVFAGNFTSAYDFYLTKPKSIYITETISPSVILCISYADFQSHCNLTKNEKKIDRFDRKEKNVKKSKLEIALICL